MKRSALFNNLFLLCFTIIEIRCDRQMRQSSISKKLTKRDVSVNQLQSDYDTFLSILNPIAIKRVSGTPQNVKVRNYLASSMQQYGWSVDVQPFNDKTPFGVKTFANIIATYQIGKNFQAVEQTDEANSESITNLKNRVVFACHYDSKWFDKADFIGATDSAVPCAILIDLAKFLQENFNKNEFKDIFRHLQFVFFDGEEAFVEWSRTDSTYGSRQMAKTLRDKHQNEAFDSIDLFVLLDLMGGDQSQFMNYFPQSTSNVYNMLSKIETILRKKNLISKKTPYYFADSKAYGQYALVEDDHLPFLNENVPVLHMIPSPFPSVWHTPRDNVQNLNVNHVQDMRVIMKYFLLQILNVRIF